MALRKADKENAVREGWIRDEENEVYIDGYNALVQVTTNDGTSGLELQNLAGGTAFRAKSDGDGYVAQNLGVGTLNPTAKLEVIGRTKTNELQVPTGATSGYVLTSDNDGVATWQNSPALATYAVGAYSNFFSLVTKPGASTDVPFDSTEFETESSMHDPSLTDSGTATGTQTSTTLQDTTQTWTVNAYTDYIVLLTGGTGSGQWRKIASNTSDTLTVGNAWNTTPDGTTTYEIRANSHKLVAPVDGIYQVTGHCSISYTAGVVGVFFYKNDIFHSLHYEHQGTVVELNGEHSRMVSLSANDYMTMRIYNGNASAVSLFGGIYRLTFQMSRVG